MSWETPKWEVGGVPLPAGKFLWKLTSGPQPFITSFNVPVGAINDALSVLVNPVTMIFDATGGCSGTPDPVHIEVSNLYLMQPQQIDPFFVRWTIADVRWSWRGKKMVYCYNKTRSSNYVQSAITVADNNPVILRQQFDTFAVGRYLEWSLIGREKAWSMKEILIEEFRKAGITYTPNSGFDEDESYIIDNVEGNGVDIYSGLANLLAASRMNMGLRLDGSVYLYSIDSLNMDEMERIYNLQKIGATGPGRIYKEDLKRIRPRNVRIRFERKEEVRVLYKTSEGSPEDYPVEPYENSPVWTLEDYHKRKVICCENVMPVPYPIEIDGRYYNIGEYIPLWKYIAALTPSITESEIREFYFFNLDRLKLRYANALATYLGKTMDEGDMQYVSKIIAAIFAHYRITYQIDPIWMSQISKIESRRCGIIDNYTGYSPPSPLFVDCCYIPSMRHPSLAKRTGVWDRHCYNWIVSVKDEYREKPSAGSVQIINPTLGVFQVTFPPMPEMVIRNVIPFAIDPIPYPSLTMTTSMLEQSKPLESHTMETILSIVWHTGFDWDSRSTKYYSDTKFYDINLDYSSLNGEGPDIDYLFPGEYARFTTREMGYIAGVGGIGGAVLSDCLVPVNSGIINAIASTEGGRMINSLLDRYSGCVTLAGWVNTFFSGNVKEIIYSFSPVSGLETSIDMRCVPFAPTLEQKFPQQFIDYVYHQLDKGEGGVVR